MIRVEFYEVYENSIGLGLRSLFKLCNPIKNKIHPPMDHIICVCSVITHKKTAYAVVKEEVISQ